MLTWAVAWWYRKLPNGGDGAGFLMFVAIINDVSLTIKALSIIINN